jgi:hypothetical protein
VASAGWYIIPEKILTDPAVTLVLGRAGNVAMLRAQPGYGDRWPSDRVVSQLVSALTADALRALLAIQGSCRRRGVGMGAGQALATGARGGLIFGDTDATITTAHSAKESPAWKKTFGFHPLAALADHGAGAVSEALEIVLRPGPRRVEYRERAH